MMNTLISLDENLFLQLNQLHNKFMDFIMFWSTNKNTWIPLYLGLIVFLISRFKKHGLIIIFAILVTVLLTDQVTSSFMKPYFKRPRPCHQEELMTQVRMLVPCGGKYGFVSSHAANSFGLAMMLFLLFRRHFRWTWLFFLWALLVSYSRIYVGVHFPGDVLFGALTGILIACLIYKITIFVFRLLHLENILN